MGPNVATPELFAKALFTDTSSWTVIDRGPFEALLPITDVLDNMLCHFDPSSAGKTQLEVRERERGCPLSFFSRKNTKKKKKKGGGGNNNGPSM